MKERILFVGQEQPLWADSRARALTLDNGWTATFARTKPEALACLQQSRFVAAALHHQPSLMVPRGFTPLTAAHFANLLAHRSQADSPTVGQPEADMAHLKKLGLEARSAEWQTKCLSSVEA